MDAFGNSIWATPMYFPRVATRIHLCGAWLASSYFVPDNLAIETLVTAKKRDVGIQIIVPGRHTVNRVCDGRRWGPLLEVGIEIFEYQPTMYHCKVMVVDGLWVSVGSTNIDNLSFRLNDEANLKSEFAHQESQNFPDDRHRSKEITRDIIGFSKLELFDRPDFGRKPGPQIDESIREPTLNPH
jgi:phosphatidylserine/phosphatidylglycerophosphate/cardiolipin synthase-like enzyme